MKWGKKVKVPVQMRGWAGPALCPLPPAPLAEPWVGGGGLAGRVQPGDFEQGRGISNGKQAASWNGRFFLASKFGGLFSRVNASRYFGGLFWRIYLAGHFCAFIWWVILAHLFGGHSQSMKQANFKASKKRKRKEKECTISGSVNCIMNIVYSQ